MYAWESWSLKTLSARKPAPILSLTSVVLKSIEAWSLLQYGADNGLEDRFNSLRNQILRCQLTRCLIVWCEGFKK
jgi:hypothetical protein